MKTRGTIDPTLRPHQNVSLNLLATHYCSFFSMQIEGHFLNFYFDFSQPFIMNIEKRPNKRLTS
jgi:hypothetical protein